jgi:lipoprotein LprG
MRVRGARSAARIVVAVSVMALALVGCSSSSTPPTSTAAPPPAAADLIATSATAMKAVTSAHFTITVTGTLPDLTVQSADGDLTGTGDAKGTAKINQLGQLVEVEFVVVAKDLYLKGPTGGFTKLPAALAGAVYDPTAILNPDKGVAKVLTGATGLSPTTESGSNYVVTGTVPKDIAAGLTPGISTDVAGTFTIDKATSQVASVAFGAKGSDGKDAKVELALSDYNKAVTVTAPPSS